MQNYLQKQNTLNDITDSETEFHYKYEVVINNVVHRKISTHLQKNLNSNTLSEYRIIYKLFLTFNSSEIQ